MTERKLIETLEAYAARAVEYEQAKDALRLAQEALDGANRDASTSDAIESGNVSFPVAVTVNDRVVMIAEVHEEYNYHLDYTIADRLE